MLAIRLMRMGAKKSPSYRVVVKEKLSKRDGDQLQPSEVVVGHSTISSR